MLNLVKEIDIQVQRVPNKMNPKRPTPRHIIIKRQKVKDKEKILKVAREKLISQQKYFRPQGTGMKYSKC